MNNTLKNKKILISAGASGIGWATAKVCLGKGATVFLCDVEQKYLHKVKKHSQINKKLLQAQNVNILSTVGEDKQDKYFFSEGFFDFDKTY